LEERKSESGSNSSSSKLESDEGASDNFELTSEFSRSFLSKLSPELSDTLTTIKQLKRRLRKQILQANTEADKLLKSSTGKDQV
jgi:hypothetical protein